MTDEDHFFQVELVNNIEHIARIAFETGISSGIVCAEIRMP